MRGQFRRRWTSGCLKISGTEPVCKWGTIGTWLYQTPTASTAPSGWWTKYVYASVRQVPLSGVTVFRYRWQCCSLPWLLSQVDKLWLLHPVTVLVYIYICLCFKRLMAGRSDQLAIARGRLLGHALVCAIGVYLFAAAVVIGLPKHLWFVRQCWGIQRELSILLLFFTGAVDLNKLFILQIRRTEYLFRNW